MNNLWLCGMLFSYAICIYFVICSCSEGGGGNYSLAYHFKSELPEINTIFYDIHGDFHGSL